MTTWKVRVLMEETINEIAFLYQNEAVKLEIRRILGLLVAQIDPRQPHSTSGLIVDEVEYDAPGWFRVKVPRYGIRIVFRVLLIQEEEIVEIERTDPIPENTDEGYIEIMQAGYRKDVYGEELRRRYRIRKNGSK